MKVATLKTGIHKVALFMLLFGVSSLTYGANQTHPLLSIVTNLTALVSAAGIMLFLFTYPAPYKVVAWIIMLYVVALVLESLHLYNQYVYSYFVIKRFAYCGLALITYYVMTRAGEVKLSWVVNLVFLFYFISQILMGKIFSYGVTSETRTTSAYEAYYLVVPFLYFMVMYMQHHKRADLIKSILTFALIVFLLHRSVISSAGFAAIIIVLLSTFGKVASSSLKVGRTVSTVLILVVLTVPFMSAIPIAKLDAFLENLGGIFDPAEDNTGSWRLEQSTHYWAKIQERPLLGWRYEGYDRGEIMENEDFAEKGTVIHSQYVDMLYNYGAFGMAVNLLIIFITLWVIYRRNRALTTEQTVLFGVITSGLLFGVSYQLPVFYWSLVGMGMFYGLHSRPRPSGPVVTYPVETADSPLPAPYSTAPKITYPL